ncbi:MAG: hypothetical protein SGJ23_11900 [Alphaproteobacteria bacterium]|nr:hypothetical protein [Alphaproteobacteria bacterium]
MIRWFAALLLLAGVAHAEPTPVAQTRAEAILVEALAYDHRDRLLISSVHAPGIYRLQRNGALKRWSARGSTQGVFGIVADPTRGDLWAASSGTAHGGDPTAKPALIRFDLRNGRVRQIIPAPEGAISFGDVALGPDGTVYVSDSGAGDVLRLRPGATTLEKVVALGGRGSPQGLAVSADARTLVFVGYGSGLHRVDLATGVHTRIETPQGMELRGVDGVVRDDDDLILVQNGIAPPRVLRLELNDDWSTVERLDVLVRDGGMQEPTGGVVRDGAFVFVSRSQWTDFDGEGKLKTPSPAPAVISRLALASPAAP